LIVSLVGAWGLGMLLSGCAEPDVIEGPTPAMPKARAVELAASALRAAGGRPDGVKPEPRARNGVWWVTFRQKPSPGPRYADVVVRVDPDGTAVIMNVSWFARSVREGPPSATTQKR
jgi:hypothetical protein